MADITRSVRQRKRPRNSGLVDLVEMFPLPPLDTDLYTLLHFYDTDGSTNFIDEKGHIFTANGNAQIDTVQSKFGGSSGLFDGAGDYITTPDSLDWRLDGGSNSNLWTIDFWTRFNGDPSGTAMGFIQQYEDVNNYWFLALASTDNLQFVVRSASVNLVNIQKTWNPASAAWYHVAVVKIGTSGYKMFIDGTQIGSTETDTDPIPNFAGGLRIGRYTGSTGTNNDLNGWLDEFRISKGIARWSSNFTPPTEEYSIYL